MNIKSLKKVIKGIVVSDRMQKTRVVEVERKVKHSLYGKIITKTSKYMVHDEKNITRIGDRVLIVYVRPISNKKSWEIYNIL